MAAVRMRKMSEKKTRKGVQRSEEETEEVSEGKAAWTESSLSGLIPVHE